VNDAPVEYSRILITTDGSDNAEVAIPHATAIAERYGSEVHVLNVVDLQAAGGVFNAGGLDQSFIERLEARGHDAVDSAAATIEASTPDLTVETAVERSKSFEGASAGVRDYVEAHDVDLVVLGSHGRSNLQRQLIGSVASNVLRTVDVPVLVVKRPE
jgi:nucleotide-binding universal stress UspA family protein